MEYLTDRDVRTVNEHLKNIYKEHELTEGSTIRKFRIVRTEGRRDVEREIDHYNLDAIISVGYRVNSKKGTQFRQWATARLKEHLVQGYTLNEVRLQQHKDQLHQLEKTLSLFQQNVIDQASLPTYYISLLKINDNALAAIALLIAQSDPAQKELMINLIMNLVR